MIQILIHRPRKQPLGERGWIGAKRLYLSRGIVLWAFGWRFVANIISRV